MTRKDLKDKLMEMQEAGGAGEKTAMTVLFGFLFSDEIQPHRGIVNELTDCPTAIRDGGYLAKFVAPPKHLVSRWKI